MSNLTMWSLLVGFLAPLVIAAIQQPKWKQHTRALVTVFISILLGGGTAYFEGQLDDASNTVGAILVVAIAAMTFYKRFWTPTKIAPAIEAATSPATEVAEVVQTEPAAVEAPTPEKTKGPSQARRRR